MRGQFLSDIELTNVLRIHGAILMQEGLWNNVYYDRSEIEQAYKQTDWKNRERKNIFLDHKDYSSGDWIGEVDGMYFKGDTLYGDLVISDPIWMAKMKNGKPKIGISPKIRGDVDSDSKTIHNFTFENFSLVLNPAVKTTYINNMEDLNMDEESITESLESDLEDEIKKKKVPEDEGEEEMKKKKKYPYPAEMSDDIILKAAQEILKKRKAPEEETSSADILEDLEMLAENFELKKKSISDIVKKAKTIRKDGESWKAAMKRAAQSLQEDEGKPDALSEKPSAAGEVKTEQKLQSTIEELSEKLRTLESRFSEPARTEYKKSSTQSVEDIDTGILKFLQELEVRSNAA
jgi:hypothetical protein